MSSPSFRLSVVQSAAALALSVLDVMVTYLTDVWKLNLTHAAAIINIFVGGRDMLLVVMVVIVDACLGFHLLLPISMVLNCIGMSLLSLSTPPILSKVVNDTQKGLYYAALPLLAIGFAGLTASSQRLVESRLNAHLTYQDLWKKVNEKLEKMAENICDKRHLMQSFKLLGRVILFLITFVGGYAIQFVKSWAIRFGISTIFIILSMFLYLTGMRSYEKGTPKGSPFTTFLRVLVASISKKSYGLPMDANELYQENVTPIMPHTNKFRCLDRAAIIALNSSLEEQKGNRWKLCTVTEVEETKIFLYMLPLWVTFAICGVVSSVGSTYFVEQGNQMNPYLGKLKLPIFTLLVFHKLGEELISFLCGTVREMLPNNRRKYAAPIGMFVAMLCSILCCISAAAVERRRLDTVKSHGLLETPKDKGKIPMTMFWLIPQYIFLSALNAISRYSSASFFNDQFPESLRGYLLDISLGVIGAGIMGSAVIVCIVGKASEIGGNPSWFQDTMNKSRLDNYYWLLAAFSSINLVFYSLVALRFPYRDSGRPGYTPPDESNVGDNPAFYGVI